ncbi:Dihydrolipoyllysine-residue acetyltransferase component of pyruvate dehydrogenase complex [Candidatus Rubidus massiliensis]|nr:Dihydrolipoyllysine-residue acetyltransferase component of pyruvate dehydrogenase complex [Candidatus Rubidus massiliensis]
MDNIYTVTFPDIGEGVVEGEIIEWLKQEGENVNQDEPVVVVMTDKTTVELPAPHPGKIVKHYYDVGQVAIKDKPLYEIELSVKIEKTKANDEKVVSKDHTVKQTRIPKDCGIGIKALPSTRKKAQELQIDLTHVQGTGKGGRITDEDLILHKSSAVPFMEEGDQVIPHKGIKGLMAKKMAESKRHIPHFSFFEQVDAERLMKLRETFKLEGEKLNLEVTYMPFLIKALSLTIKKFPEINSSYDEPNQQLILHHRHNIGFAVSTEYGLIVPVLKDVQNLSLNDLIAKYCELKIQALHNKLQTDDLKGATITLSNFGVVSKGGGLWATPVINFPEVAILAAARIQKQPVIKNDTVVVKSILNLSWSFDHRVIDGEMAAYCSHYFAQVIENPAVLLN